MLSRKSSADGGFGSSTGWPGALGQLVRELQAGRGRPALLDGASLYVDVTAARIAEHSTKVSLAEMVATAEVAPSAADLFGTLGDGLTLLVDIEILFTPALGVEVLPQLRLLAQRRPLIALWPGQIGVTRVSYSLPGRIDYLDEPVRDLVVLRPVPTEFPDETPYELERFPA